MSENESGFYKLQDDVQQAFLFMDEVVQLVDSPNPIRAKTDIKHLIEFRDRVKEALGFPKVNISTFDQGESVEREIISDDEAIAEIERLQANQNRSDKTILDRLAEQEEFEKAPRYDPQEVSEVCDDSDHKSAKDREIERLNRCLSEIVDILNKANTECLDHYRSKQEEKIVLTGFRRLCDIHAALFKKRSDYEIYGSRIINDLLNSVDLQAQKQANQNRFDSATYDPFQDKYKLENIEHAISFRATVASYLGCSYDRNEAIAKIEQLKRNATYTLEQQNLETFWRKIRVLFGNTEMGFESAYNRIVDLLHNPEQFTGDKDREIEPPSRVYNVHVTTTGNPSKIAEAIQKELLRNESIQEEYEKAPHYDPQENPGVCDDSESVKDREIERLNRCISGIASFLDLPSDAKQPDICFAIMELRQKYKKISQEPSSYEQIVIVDWIARLVGK
jgi:hypothetical protein